MNMRQRLNEVSAALRGLKIERRIVVLDSLLQKLRQDVYDAEQNLRSEVERTQ